MIFLIRGISLLALLLTVVFPASGQDSKGAGVVTALQGQATVSRPIIPRPLPLKYKDDVFVRDRIDTRENSVVRLLLGGKALVTVRELSVLTITEEPNRAVVDLQSGKIAVGLAKKLLKPGESIEIRTPNAVASVRGSYLFAAYIGGVGTFVAGQVTVAITVASRANPNLTFTLGSNDSVSASGSGATTTFTQVQAATAAQRSEAAQAGQAPKSEEHTRTSPAAITVSGDQVKVAAELALVVTGGGVTQTPPPPRPSTSDTCVQCSVITNQATQPPPPPALSAITPNQLTDQDGLQTLTLTGSGFVTGSQVTLKTGGMVIQPTTTVVSSTQIQTQVDFPVGAQWTAQVTNVNGTSNSLTFTVLPNLTGVTPTQTTAGTAQTLTLTGGGFAPGAQVILRTGDQVQVITPTSVTPTQIQVQVSGTLTAGDYTVEVTNPGDVASAPLGFTVLAAAPPPPPPPPPSPVVTPDVEILNTTRTLASGESLKTFSETGDRGTLSTPVVKITNSQVSGPGTVIQVDGGANWTVAAPLLDVSGSNLSGLSNVLSIHGSLTNTSTSTSITLDPTTISTLGDFILIGSGGNLSLAGSLLTDIGGTLEAGGNFLHISAGGTLRSDGSNPLFQFTSSTVTTGQDFIRIAGAPVAPATSILSLNGPLLRATDTTFVSRGAASSLFTSPSTSGLPRIWEPGFGRPVINCDDCTTSVSFGFTFPFQGRTFTGAEVSSNGFLSLGGFNGHGCCSGNVSGFLSGVARIAPAWFDLIEGGGVRYRTFSDRVVVTWDRNQEFCCFGSNTMQVQLLSDGRIVFGYASVNNVSHTALVGVTPGGGVADPGAVDFLHALPFSSGVVGTIYQLFAPGTLDLDGRNIVFTPNALGGWDVSSSLGSPFISLAAGAVVNQSGGGPFAELTRTTLTSGWDSLLQLSGASRLTVGGTLLDMTDSTLALTGPLARLEGESTLRNRAGPVIRISGGSLTAAALASTDGAGNRIDLTGSLLDLSGTTVTLGSLAEEPSGSTDSFTLTLARNEPAIRMSSSTLTLSGEGKSLVKFGVEFEEESAPIQIPTEPGVALIATGTSTNPTTINLKGRLLKMFAVDSTATAALIQLDHTAVNQTETSEPLISVNPHGLTSTMAGPMLNVADSMITTSGALLHIRDGSLTSNLASAALLQFESSRVTTGQSLVRVTGWPVESGTPTLSLRGPLVRATDTTFIARGGMEPGFGRPVINCDDCTTSVSFGFTFPFQGRTFTGAEVSSNGFLSLGGFNGHGCCSGNVSGFLSGVARIAPAWFDLIEGGGVRYRTFSDRVVVTWDRNQEFCCFGSNTMQVQLLSDGRIVFGYASVNNVSHTALVGVTPGGGVADPGAVDFSRVIPFSSGAVGTVYELFHSGTFDLSDNIIVFTPNELGGWDVSNALSFPFIAITDGAVVSQSGGDPFVQLTRTGLTSGWNIFLHLSEGASLDLGWSLLAATDSALTLEKALVKVSSGGTLVTRPLAVGSYPLVTLSGGTLVVGTGTFSGTLFNLTGTAAAADGEPNPVTLVTPSGLTLGTDQPIQHRGGGALFETTNAATVNVGGPEGKAYKIDTALLEATAPLLNLTGNSILTTSGNTIDLSFRAKVSSLGDAMIRLDGSTVNVTNGHLVNVAGGSRLNVAGDLVHLLNGSNLNISNGTLLNVSGGSIAQIGTLVRFSNSPGNTSPSRITINNSIAPTLGVLVAGFPVSVPSGATLSVAPGAIPIIGRGASGSISVAAGGSLLAVAPGSTLRIGP